MQQQNGSKDYRIIRFPRYGAGIAELRRRGTQPKTFKENIKARVIAYENGDTSLFDTWLDSCTGIATKRKSTLFKIVPRSTDLISIPKNFREPFSRANYDSFHGITELDSTKGKYNQSLPEENILNHDGWLNVVEGNAVLLKAYRDIIFHGFKKERAMGFWVKKNTDEDELRALFVFGLNDGSDADGGGNLGGDGGNDRDSYGSFLLGSPVRAAGARKRTPAKRQEQLLEEKLAEGLSRFDKYVGNCKDTQYNKEKQEFLQEFCRKLTLK